MIDTFELVNVALIDPSPTNPRRRFDETKLQELANSIKSHGLIQPVIVRATEDNRFELVAGERRLRAVKLADLPHIQAIVRPLTDAQVLEMQLLENNQREDVHPLEEGEAIRRILDAGVYGYERVVAIKTIAEKLGKSMRYIYQRLEFEKLTEESRDEFLVGEISAMHAVELARLSPDAQAICIAYLLYDTEWVGNGFVRKARKEGPTDRSVRELQGYIREKLTPKLDGAKFDRESITLIPQAGSCSACPLRTGFEAELSGDDGPDRCLNPGCFISKTERHKSNLAEAAEKAHGQLLKISTKGYSDHKDTFKGPYQEVPEGTPGAVPAIIVETYLADRELARRGDLVFIKPGKAPSSSQGPKQSGSEKAQAEEKKRQLAIEKDYRKSLFDACMALLPVLPGGPLLDHLLTQWGHSLPGHLESVCRLVGHSPHWEGFGPQLKSCLLWARDASSDLYVDKWNFHPGSKPKNLTRLAEIAGVDIEHVRREAEEKHAPKTNAGKNVKAQQLIVSIEDGEEVVEQSVFAEIVACNSCGSICGTAKKPGHARGLFQIGSQRYVCVGSCSGRGGWVELVPVHPEAEWKGAARFTITNHSYSGVLFGFRGARFVCGSGKVQLKPERTESTPSTKSTPSTSEPTEPTPKTPPQTTPENNREAARRFAIATIQDVGWPSADDANGDDYQITETEDSPGFYLPESGGWSVPDGFCAVVYLTRDKHGVPERPQHTFDLAELFTQIDQEALQTPTSPPLLTQLAASAQPGAS